MKDYLFYLLCNIVIFFVTTFLCKLWRKIEVDKYKKVSHGYSKLCIFENFVSFPIKYIL